MDGALTLARPEASDRRRMIMVGAFQPVVHARIGLVSLIKQSFPNSEEAYPLFVWLDAAAAGVALFPLPLAGFTAPVGMTDAPAFSNCLGADAMSSSLLFSNEAVPCASRSSATSATSTPARRRSSMVACA